MSKLISQSNKQAFRNPWVLGWIAMVAIVFGVEVFGISRAFKTDPGLVSRDYYKQGRDLESSIHTRQEEQAALGWTLNLDMAQAHMARPAAFRLNATDKSGKPLTGANVIVYAYRPADSSADFSVPLGESAPGQFVGDVTFPLKGLWELIIEVKQGEHTSQLARKVIAFAN